MIILNSHITADVIVTGGIVSGFCALIAINALLSILFIIIPACARSNLSSRTLLFQSTNFLVLSLGLFAGLVPFTIFFATHEASVIAFIGKVEVPAGVVQAIEKALGVTTVYRDIPYRKLTSALTHYLLIVFCSTPPGHLALVYILTRDDYYWDIILRTASVPCCRSNLELRRGRGPEDHDPRDNRFSLIFMFPQGYHIVTNGPCAF